MVKNMGYYRRWKPSKSAAREFHNTMNEIDDFCRENGIDASRSKDSYYFTINGQNYRVSNHSVEASNEHSKSILADGTVLFNGYHTDGRKADTIYIHASKTRIREIYNDLKDGFVLDGRGNRK